MPAHTQDNWTVLNTQKALHLSSKVSQLTQLLLELVDQGTEYWKGSPSPREQIRQHSWKSVKTKYELFKFLNDVLVNATSMSSTVTVTDSSLFTTKWKFVVSDGSIDLSGISLSDREETNNRMRLYLCHTVTDRH